MRVFKVEYVLEFAVEAESSEQAYEMAKNHMMLPAGFRTGEDKFIITDKGGV